MRPPTEAAGHTEQKDIGIPYEHGLLSQTTPPAHDDRIVMSRPQADRRPWRKWQLDQAQRDGLITTGQPQSHAHNTWLPRSNHFVILCWLLALKLPSYQLKYSQLPLFGLDHRHPLLYEALPDWAPRSLWAHDIGPGALLTSYIQHIDSLPLYHITTSSGSPDLS